MSMEEEVFYYDPETGICRRHVPCRGHHLSHKIYWEPCLECQQFCNCEWQMQYPDIMVRTLDNQDIRVSSHVVASSDTLKDVMYNSRAKARLARLRGLPDSVDLKESMAKIDKEEYLSFYGQLLPKAGVEEMDFCSDDDAADVEMITIMDDNSSSEDDKNVDMIDVIYLSSDSENDWKRMDKRATNSDSEEQTVGLCELFEFPQNKFLDLRSNNAPTYGISAETWRWIENYIGLHLDQVDETVDAERRAEEFFKRSFFPRPKKDEINYWRYYDWEELLFANMSPIQMMELAQAKHELKILDLHIPMQKWLCLYRGIPMIKDFGWGQYFTEVSREMLDSGYEDFLEGRSKVIWNFEITFHNKIPRRTHPDSALLWRNRIWKPYPTKEGYHSRKRKMRIWK